MNPYRDDLRYFVRITAIKSDLYKTTDAVTTDEIFFWYKCLTRSFFAFVDSLGSSLSQGLVEHAARLQVSLSRTLHKKLQRPATIPKMYLALRHFPALFGASPIALPAEGDADAVALRLLTDCRDGFAHPKSMRNFYPPALLASALPAIEWLLSAWHALFATCLHQLSGREPVLRERTFGFDAAQVEGFEKKLAPLYEPSETPAFMKMILALTDDTGRALKLLSKSAPSASELPSPPCALRNLARTLFSDIEGTTFILADHLADCGAGERPDSNFLRGKDEEVRERIADVLDRFSCLVGNACVVRREGAEWERFPTARRFRDRITHPHAPESADGTQTELDATLATLTWWHGEVRGCLDLDPSKYACVSLGLKHETEPASKRLHNRP